MANRWQIAHEHAREEAQRYGRYLSPLDRIEDDALEDELTPGADDRDHRPRAGQVPASVLELTEPDEGKAA